MTTVTSESADSLSSWITLLLAFSCGLIVANIYYAQPLIGPISADLGLPPQLAGLLVTMSQIGYGAGLLLIVPLGDLIENRKLVIVTMAVGAAALACAALATSPATFLFSALLIGVGSVAVQILIPYAGHMAPEAIRGRTVGNVSTGLMLGIMLARPVASFVAAHASWHVIYAASALAMVILAVVLRVALPPREPAARLSYGQLLGSMVELYRDTPALRRRALYQAALFSCFSVFWTTSPLLLAGPDFRMSQSGIALFALVGVGGAIMAPIAGRIADRGWTRPASVAAMLLCLIGFALTLVFPLGSTGSLTTLVIAAIAIDCGVQLNLILGYRVLFVLGAGHRSRLNGLYMTTFFVAGAAGSGIGAYAYAHGGWMLAAALGIALPVAALAYFMTEPR
ncbi:putative major facilitator superfamily (MSF) transporter [Bradyrhizobium sp. ORS 285]|uniref:MFS transporter n=1 Tax=Bradyrhizobium sp. ORS 285 TaxID=115808 RepID=UPI000240AC04|nr:MFS transporter [Bradyrhizobium sp. ORS 285]CCD88252.1 putative major facilitator superfamily (MSF) transporter [Bradyrhizobium sp. ORS 285]SMX55540.1 putative major facilitator superfamily (MSF) transporter [Bradyrhizobium sp. ORS 285]